MTMSPYTQVYVVNMVLQTPTPSNISPLMLYCIVYTNHAKMYIHMPKKYLLYIHPIQFDSEPHKSELVNKLLRSHYANETISQPTVLSKAIDLGEAIAVHKQSRPVSIDNPTISFCKHDQVLGFCKKGCR